MVVRTEASAFACSTLNLQQTPTSLSNHIVILNFERILRTSKFSIVPFYKDIILDLGTPTRHFANVVEIIELRKRSSLKSLSYVQMAFTYRPNHRVSLLSVVPAIMVFKEFLERR